MPKNRATSIMPVRDVEEGRFFLAAGSFFFICWLIGLSLVRGKD